MRFPVFLHGTTFMHAAGVGLACEECLRQVRRFEAIDHLPNDVAARAAGSTAW
ncbi:MAG TPA: hypothetical protein VF116_19845 [Ktedonobacterales bacterium]